MHTVLSSFYEYEQMFPLDAISTILNITYLYVQKLITQNDANH